VCTWGVALNFYVRVPRAVFVDHPPRFSTRFLHRGGFPTAQVHPSQTVRRDGLAEPAPGECRGFRIQGSPPGGKPRRLSPALGHRPIPPAFFSLGACVSCAVAKRNFHVHLVSADSTGETVPAWPVALPSWQYEGIFVRSISGRWSPHGRGR